MRLLITGTAPAIRAAAAIVRAIEDPATPLRVPVGHDAVAILAARSQLDDAAFEAAMRETLGLTW